MQTLDQFLDDWQASGQETALFFRAICDVVKGFDEVTYDFSGRPGISYSVRPTHQNLKERKFFAIMDVIDDEPDDRWLSICFYSDFITDPDELGDLVPGGLAGGDGYCFDVYANDEKMFAYLKERLMEAYQAAASA